jgi:hypothetical protein
MTNHSHGNQQRSPSRKAGNVQRLSRKGVEPSGSKRGATLKRVGEIVWTSSKGEEDQTLRVWPQQQIGLGDSPATTQCIRQRCHPTPYSAFVTPTRHRPSPKAGVTRQAASRGRVLPPFPTPFQTTPQPVHEPRYLLDCENGCAQSAQETHQGATYSSSRYIRRNTAQRFRGCSPWSNRLYPCRNSESPSTGQRRVDMRRQPCISSDARSTALCRSRHRVVVTPALVHRVSGENPNHDEQFSRAGLSRPSQGSVPWRDNRRMGYDRSEVRRRCEVQAESSRRCSAQDRPDAFGCRNSCSDHFRGLPTGNPQTCRGESAGTSACCMCRGRYAHPAQSVFSYFKRFYNTEGRV